MKKIRFVLITLLITTLSACGSGSDINSNSETGSIAFRLEWEQPPTIPLNKLYAASPDICVDYGISSISANAINSSNTSVKSDNWPCSAHQGVLRAVPPASNYTVKIEGATSTGSVAWRGENTGITVVSGQTASTAQPVTVTMTYIGGDTTPPTVSSVTPSDNSTNASVTTIVEAAFSENMAASSIDTSTFTLKQGTTAVNGTVTYNSTTKTATFTPSSNLSYSTTYTAAITTGVKDMAGNNMQSNYSWSWTTGTASSDTTAPDTSITAQPSNPSNSTSPSFSFTSTETGSTFQCQLDSGGYSTCTSPVSYTGLSSGSHSFYVKATDSAGNTDSTPASYTWTIDTTVPDTSAPDTTITAQPSNPSNSTSASFSFTSTETGSTFQCQIDAGGYSACTSPKSYTGLTAGSHIFNVRATDSAVNTDSTPASYTWTIDTSVPTVPTGLSAAVISDTQINLSWTASTSTDVTGYKIYRDGTYLASSTTTSYSDTTCTGATAYTYTVTAYDAAGNESAQSSSASATTRGITIIGLISADTAWTLINSPYVVTGNVLVNSGVTLTIEPGVIVKFNGNYYLQVEGTLIARGTTAQTITFTSNQPNPAPGDWGRGIETHLEGIRFMDSSLDATFDAGGNYVSGSILQYAIVEYGTGVSLNAAAPFIDHNVLRYNAGEAALFFNGYGSGSPVLSNNTITGNTSQLGVNIQQGSPILKHNLIWNNSGGAMYITDNANITHNTIVGNAASDGYILIALPGSAMRFNYNNIYGNGNGVDIKMRFDATTDINATNNYWGTTTTAEMDAKGTNANISTIYDYYDDFNLGKVIYSNWLSAPDPESPTVP
jgi:hypothetical protein